MKGVFIKWHRTDPWKKRKERKAAIRNAWRTIRQQSRWQLKEISKDFHLSEHEIVPAEWYECLPDSTPVQYFDDFMHPSVRLGYFD